MQEYSKTCGVRPLNGNFEDEFKKMKASWGPKINDFVKDAVNLFLSKKNNGEKIRIWLPWEV